jgi:hypothetical protein
VSETSKRKKVRGQGIYQQQLFYSPISINDSSTTANSAACQGTEERKPSGFGCCSVFLLASVRFLQLFFHAEKPPL